MQHLKTWLPAILWMSVIFAMSAMPGDVSGEQSGLLVSIVLDVISFFFGKDAAAGISIQLIHLLIRKAAHMTEYAVLFFLYHRALRLENAKHPGLYALLMCALYASTDEFHQGFVAGRGPGVIDVLIDTLGAGIALGITWTIRQIKRKRN
ncbi:MAG: VanZ family protein [Clostridia bacterium]|nr:VanZ family protein [Clostridia bacterium]